MKRLLLFFVSLLLSVGVSVAQETATINGIKYELYETGSASVMEQDKSLSGDIVIPSTVEYKDKTYKVTKLSKGSFQSTSIRSIVLPEGITELPDYCFENCTNLSTIKIPNSVTKLGVKCFDGCTNLSTIKIPNSVTTLGGGCFDGCTNLSTIKIPNSVTTLGGGCFYGCTNLSTIEIPNSVTSIGSLCFSGCTNLSTIEIPNSVTSIGDGCFGSCTNLSTIEIPNSVTSIGRLCFYGCTNLSTIEIPNSVTSIGDRCFDGCTNLSTIEIPNSVTSIGFYCFYNCSSLSTVKIHNGVTKLGTNCFENCTSLSTIEIPKSVTDLPEACFSNCSNLSTVKIHNGVKFIRSRCFYSCNSLEKINIPASVRYIGSDCFANCISLTEIKFPKSRYNSPLSRNPIFSGCSKLYKVIVQWDAEDLYGQDVVSTEDFNDISPESFLYVPKGTANLYKKTLPWSKFKYIIEEDTPYNALVLNEDVKSYDYLTESYDGAFNDVDLFLNLTLTPNEWTTFVLPVSLTLDQFSTTFGADAKLAELTGLNSQDFRFTVKSRKNLDGNANFVEANKVYLLKATTAPSSTNVDYTYMYDVDGLKYYVEAEEPNYVISHVTLDKKNLTMGDTFNNLPALKNADTYRYGDVTATFYGTLLQTSDNNDSFLGSYSFVDGKFYNFQAPYGFKAFRGWLTAINAAGQPVKMRAEVYDGGTSEIVNLHVDGKQPTKGKVYNMQGQVVSNNGSVENLPAGMYIVNNKKVIVKH